MSLIILDASSIVQCRAEISTRGSSSAKHPKRPYRLELQDVNGDDLKLPILGIPKESDWILYPAYTDKTLIRDVLAYELWRQMGYWAPRTRYVHLFIRTNSAPSATSVLDSTSLPSRPSVENSEFTTDLASIGVFSADTSGYEGVYILMEKIKRGKHRVNIEKLPRSSPTPNSEPGTPNLSGGYIFKKDRYNNTNERTFRTSKKIELIIEEPKGFDITVEQEAYLTNYINEFELVLFSDYFDHPEIGYRRYVDVESFIDYHWMQELGKNADAYWFSEFYHKNFNEKLKIGPIWDFDMAFGNTWYNEGYETNNWRWQRSSSMHYRWFKRMFKDPEFLQRYIDRWGELRATILSTTNILSLIDGYAAEICEAQKLNYQRWPTLGKKVGPVYFIGQTWQEEVRWFKDWMIGRLAWIDSQDFPKPVITITQPLLSVPSVLSVANSELQTSNPASNHNPELRTKNPEPQYLSVSCLPGAGSIFYTTNNTDPRVPGGHVSTNALEYKSPIFFAPGLTVKARVRSDYGLWSAPAMHP